MLSLCWDDGMTDRGTAAGMAKTVCCRQQPCRLLTKEGWGDSLKSLALTGSERGTLCSR